ncbi:MAG: oxidoreductase domain protein [Marmoricola sp.]|jgi:predicted dehydrogenase|nr:oxidoreductase domain protein [Marmoricola sp.]
MEQIGWGVLATGKIAHTFVNDLKLLPDARLVAAGSRSLASAEAFVAEHGGTPYGSYAELVADPAVDVVYVASPHSLHDEHVRLAFDAGKAVLCEKPMTLDAPSSEALIALARERGLFLMEAMWMTCNPLVRRLRDLATGGDYGEVRQVVADLGFRVDADPASRMLDPALGASTLLDMGIYPLTFAHLLLGQPSQTSAVANLTDRGVDLDIAISLAYPSGAVAALTSSMTSWTARTATVATDRGRFDVAADFHTPVRITFTAYDGPDPQVEVIETPADDPVIGRGYGNEAAEVMRCLRAGELESPFVPHAQTLDLMRQMDGLRQQLGILG